MSSLLFSVPARFALALMFVLRLSPSGCESQPVETSTSKESASSELEPSQPTRQEPATEEASANRRAKLEITFSGLVLFVEDGEDLWVLLPDARTPRQFGDQMLHRHVPLVAFSNAHFSAPTPDLTPWLLSGDNIEFELPADSMTAFEGKENLETIAPVNALGIFVDRSVLTESSPSGWVARIKLPGGRIKGHRKIERSVRFQRPSESPNGRPCTQQDPPPCFPENNAHLDITVEVEADLIRIMRKPWAGAGPEPTKLLLGSQGNHWKMLVANYPEGVPKVRRVGDMAIDDHFLWFYATASTAPEPSQARVPFFIPPTTVPGSSNLCMSGHQDDSGGG